MFFFLDSIGTFVFAISGALAAMNKRLDPFGIFIIALLLHYEEEHLETF